MDQGHYPVFDVAGKGRRKRLLFVAVFDGKFGTPFLPLSVEPWIGEGIAGPVAAYLAIHTGIG